ncbi:DUF2795 domain-containing protein [Saccharopolyspora phatthalungensis]|uniref:DUF2795 domain-containing protein n=1 Tax=Saccharopolyspora phatthalungensis TaxID=664693 RepID=A0A840QGR9_9PSEU|nr:DUF2795 domain-containing protein [Saccharopolyspora phatthalungensis]MBB5157735.1 hypothetical protein [Saccharopolyspora phatthalungensis]
MPVPDRGELLRFLCHVRFPATKQEIFQQCVALGAPMSYLERIESLPEGVYVEPDTVLQALPRQAP